MKKKFTYSEGYLLIEVLISIVFLSVILVTIVSTLSFLIRRQARTKYDSQAGLILQEGVEIAYNVLMSDWESYSEGEYYPSLDMDNHKWLLSSGEEPPLEGRFTRILEIMPVCRNLSGTRMVPPCTPDYPVDDKSKEIRVSVSWQEGKVEASLLAIKQLIY